MQIEINNKLEYDIIKEALFCFLDDSRNQFRQQTNELYNRINAMDDRMFESFISSDIIFNKEKATVIGELGNGDLLIQISKDGAIKQVKQSQVKILNAVPLAVKPEDQFKIDKLTQKVLFEESQILNALLQQYVPCGIYMGNIPIKINECFVKYSDWNTAKPNETIQVKMENKITLIEKEKVRLLENINNMLDTSNYVEGVLIDETGAAISSLMINSLDYIEAVGDSDLVKVIINNESGPELQSYPKGSLKTLTI